MPRLSDDTLAELNVKLIQQSANYLGEEVWPKRKRNREYYDGKNPENLKLTEGRSQIVDNVVKDTVEWILPSLIRIFNSGDKIISIEGHGEEDVERAEKVETWVNYVEGRMNPGFLNDYTWFKDALIERDGWEKVYWVEEESVNRDDFELVTDEQLKELKDDDTYEILEVESGTIQLLDDISGEEVSVKVHNVTGNRITSEWVLRVEVLEPDTVLHLENMTGDRKTWWFVSHKSKKRISELRELGFDVDDDIQGPEIDEMSADISYESLSDWRDQEDDDGLGALDPSLREVWVYESFIRTDADGDGVAEWNKVVQVGTKILGHDQEPEPNLFHVTPVIRPHRLSGEGAADLVADLQELMTALNRQVLDSIYLSNNPRSELVTGGMTQHTWNDYHNNAAGAPIRVKQAGTVNPLQTAQLQPWTFNLLEYWEGKKENRSGTTRYNQGLDANSLNKTATGITQIMQSAMQRIELLARILAETGVKDKMRYIIDTSARFPEYVDNRSIRLQGRKLDITSADVQGRYDLVINPAVGTGNKQQTLQNVIMLMDFYERAAGAGLGPGSEKALFAVNNLFNAAREMIKSMGWRNTGDFLIDPMSDGAEEMRDPVKEPQPGPDMIKAKTDAEKAKGDLEMKQQELQLELQESQAELALKKRELDLKERELELEQYRVGIEAAQADGAGAPADTSNVVDIEDRIQDRALKERELLAREREIDARIAEMRRGAREGGGDSGELNEALAELEKLQAKVNSPKVFHRDRFGQVVAINNDPVLRDEDTGLILGIGVGPEDEEQEVAS